MRNYHPLLYAKIILIFIENPQINNVTNSKCIIKLIIEIGRDIMFFVSKLKNCNLILPHTFYYYFKQININVMRFF